MKCVARRATAHRRSKITVRVSTRVLTWLTDRTNAACLRRDQLISHALEIELPRIRQEIPFKNSPSARRYIEERLRTLFFAGGTQFSLALDAPVSKLLDQVCTEKNIPREALLNRLLLLLGAPGEFVAEHFFMMPNLASAPNEVRPDLPTGADAEALLIELQRRNDASTSFDQGFSVLGHVASTIADPLKRYRELLQLLHEQLLVASKGNTKMRRQLTKNTYAFTPFGMPLEEEALAGLNCYLPDLAVMGGMLLPEVPPTFGPMDSERKKRRRTRD